MKFLRREEIGVELIKPDPNQPRKFFNNEVIRSMAATMVSGLKKEQTGLINDIEIDDKYVIITGEQRFRAAKLAGKKTVMCKIFTNIDPDERYYRQGIENIHRGNMTPMEVSDFFVKVLVSMGWNRLPPGGKRQGRTPAGRFTEEADKFVIDLCKKTGMGKTFIYEKLSHQNEKPEVKEYLKKPDAKASIIRSINQRAPDELKDILKEKVLDGSLKNREVADELIRALVGYENENIPPKQTQQRLLYTSYTAPTVRENLKKIDNIYPEETTEQKTEERDNDASRAFSNQVAQLTLSAGRLNLSKIPPSHKQAIINGCNELIDRLELIVGVISGKLLQGEESDENE